MNLLKSVRINFGMIKNRSGKLSISITGHRFIPDDPRLDNSIHRVLTDIRANPTEEELILYSALAEGADQLVAKIALKLGGFKLCVPLPKPVDEYLKDFISEGGKERFYQHLSCAAEVIPLPMTDEHENAYQSLAYYLVQQADIMVAIWNGNFNHEDGGTGAVVRVAQQTKIPVYWIYAPNQKPGENNPLEGKKEIGAFELID